MGLKYNPFGQIPPSAEMWTLVYDGYFTIISPGDVKEEVYNCEDNGDLFLALSAINDSTDYMQWFIYEDENEVNWIKCNQDDIADMMWSENKYLYCRKAEKNEIIDHFTLY